ncbi:hypothetical protein H7I41_02610 [Mycobacterium manitobense]|uniref:Uncharacterized protein n=1 Tax=[Mycobacterium] manitobense TaxID=190147 RepID=A0A9X3BLE3_9MYCO|nr:hypothetical protein [[Mycobacterium] manitobense]MCV7168810.1 hypothetical protein [[Mycobacterium] manitobense]
MTTTHVVHVTLLDAYRRRGYFYREAAMLTIGTGVVLHLFRVLFGDDLTLQYVLTRTTDMALLVPMIYAAVTGILVWRRVDFANRPHRVFFTWALVYIVLSVPLHVYFGVVKNEVAFYFEFFPMWFSYLLFPFYAAMLTMFWRLRVRN